MSLANPRLVGLTPESRRANVQARVDRRLAVIERRGHAGGTGAVDLTPFVRKDTLTARGDIYAATASGVVTKLPVPTLDGSADGWVLTIDSTTATGLAWAAVPGLPSVVWDVVNYAVDRTYDANATTLHELADVFGTLVMDDLPGTPPAYTITNDTSDKVLDCNSVTLHELADVLATAIDDLIAATGAGTYTVTNLTVRRDLNANSLTIYNLADAIGTMLTDEGLAP